MADPHHYRHLGQRHLLLHGALPGQSQWWYVGRATPLPGYRLSHSRLQCGDVLVQVVWRAPGTLHQSGADIRLPAPCALLAVGAHSDPDWSLVHTDPAAELWSLLGRGQWLRAAVAELITQHGPVLPIDEHHAVWQELRQIASRLNQAPLVQDGGTAMALCARMIHALAHASTTAANLAERTAAALLRDLADPPTIAELAARFDVSREHLTRRFRNQYGEAPATWLRRQRLELARRLLQTSDDSVAHIAGLVGYRAVDRFSRAFKQYFGASPTHVP